MLKIYKYNNLINVSAEVFMSEHHQANNGLNYWELRLLTQGQLIDAYHWYSAREHKINYRNKDAVLVVGNWATRHKQCFQIIKAEVISYHPANDDNFHESEPPQNLTVDLVLKVKKEEL